MGESTYLDDPQRTPDLRRGRPRSAPTSSWSLLLSRHMDENGISLSDVAEKLPISLSETSRIVNGLTKTIHSITFGEFADAFGLEGQRRSELLAGAKADGISFPAVPKTTNHWRIATGRNKSQLVDVLNVRVSHLEAELTPGGTKAATGVLKEAMAWFHLLDKAWRDASGKVGRPDPDAGRMHINWGRLVLIAQKTTLRWHEMPAAGIATCRQISEIIAHYDSGIFAREEAALCEEQAVLYREYGQFYQDRKAFIQGFKACERGLAALQDGDIHDPGLEALLRGEYAHLIAVLMCRPDVEIPEETPRLSRESLWKEKLDEVRAQLTRTREPEANSILGLIDYYEGTGAKYVAGCKWREESVEEQRSWARRSLDALQHASPNGQALFERTWNVQQPGRVLIHRLNAAQAKVFLDPDEAIHELEILMVEIRRRYLSLAPRVQAVLNLAKELKQRDNTNRLLEPSHNLDFQLAID